MKRCNNCGGIFGNGWAPPCPNCGREDISDYERDTTWYDRYASEKMSRKDAEEFFGTNEY